MSKKTKIWLVIASFLVLAGSIVFGGAMTMLKWDFTKLSTVKYETKDYEINEDYKNISVVTDTADILFVPSESERSSVVCLEQKDANHSVMIKDGTLVIEIQDTRKWYEYIGINLGTPKIKVYIPKGEYGSLSVKSSTGDVEIPKEFKFESIDISVSTSNIKNFASVSNGVKIETSTGDINLENINAKSMDLSVSTGRILVSHVICETHVNLKVSTGKVNLTDIKCENFASNGNTGDISLKNVIAEEKLSINRSTGDVVFDGCDAAEIFVKTDTGDVKGSLLTDKIFVAQTDTGRVDVPKTVTGGKCEIVTDTGDIRIHF